MSCLEDTAALGDIAEFIRGITFKPNDVVPSGATGSVRCMRTKNVQTEIDLSDVWSVDSRFVKRANQYLQAGDLLVSSANSWNLVGKCCWVPEGARGSTFGGFISALRPNRERVDPRYLYRWFSSDQIQATVRSFGRQTTNISNLDFKRCLSLPILLPSLDRQRWIAQVLDSVDALRVKRREVITLLDDLAWSIFLDMFGNPVGNSRDWPVLPFGEVCQTRLGKMLDARAQTSLHLRPYLRNANVQWFRIDTSDLLQMDFNEDDRRVFSLAPGDVLICEGGDPGRAAIWRGELQECYFQKALHRARPREGVAISDYVVHLLWFYSKQGGFNGHVSAATIAHLTGEKLRKMSVPVPPIDIQRHFSRRIQSLDSLKLSHKTGLAGLDGLFATLQHRAFRGELWNHTAA